MIEDLLEDCTMESNTTENWNLIIHICEECEQSEQTTRDCIHYLSKRLLHKNVNVVLYSLTVLNALVQNCGLKVKREISSRKLLDSLVKLVANKSTHEIICNRILDLIQQWQEQFKDPSLQYMQDTFNELVKQGYPFPTKQSMVKPRHDEDEDLQLALALSMSQEQKPKPRSLFSVKALYDFAGSDQGELPLVRGDVIQVYDDTAFKDWWKGECNGKIGIFPSNYVERVSTQHVQQQSTQHLQHPPGQLESSKVDHLLRILSTVDSRVNLSQHTELQEAYHSVLVLRPNLITQLESLKQQREELVELCQQLQKACQGYHRLQEAASQYYQPQYAPYYGQPPYQSHRY